MSRTERTRRQLIAGAVIVVLVVMLIQGVRFATGGASGDGLTVTADFEDTTGLYVGNEVTYLGVRIGEVVEVERRGTTMRAILHLDPDTRVPADAGAEILQSSLVTDRTIELGPAYRKGPTLADGAHIDVQHTRSPATVDEIATALDDLVLALDAGLTTTRGKKRGQQNLGDMIGSTADTLRGNGTALRRALSAGSDALGVVNDEAVPLKAVSRDLSQIVALLDDRDRRIRRFTSDSVAGLGVLADQRDELAATLDSLDDLTLLSNRFLKDNAAVLGKDLAGLSDLVGLVRKHQNSLAEAFDVMPTMAENYARAYDWDQQRLRVQFSFTVGPFSAAFRDHTCQVFAQSLPSGSELCSALFNQQGTGMLDGILDGLFDAVPGGIP